MIKSILNSLLNIVLIFLLILATPFILLAIIYVAIYLKLLSLKQYIKEWKRDIDINMNGDDSYHQYYFDDYAEE